jgi:adenosine kinase
LSESRHPVAAPAGTRRILVSGSVAFDTIMVFEGRFEDHILPDRAHVLNVSFLAPRLKREYGGCAANIAYNLRGLGGEPAILAAVGNDASEYLERLRAMGIDTRAVRVEESHYTAQAFITTDLADNQINAFHPGAMSVAHLVRVGDALPACWGIVGPNGKQAMVEHAQGLADAGVPFVFDPGQGMPMFDGAELRRFVEAATAVVVNDYEAAMLVERTGMREEDIARQVEALIVTKGGEGSVLYHGGEREHIEPAPVSATVDPTGCGDAYRGGLLYGLANGWDWLRCARLGSLMGAIKIESQGPQNHPIDRDAIAERFERTWGERPW